MLPQPTTNPCITTYNSVEEFKAAAQAKAKAEGFAFSTASSDIQGKNHKTPFISLQCVMGGNYRNNHKITEESHKRLRHSKKQKCPVHVTANWQVEHQVWDVQWREQEHNHDLLRPLEIHYLHQHRMITNEQKNMVSKLLAGGMYIHIRVKGLLC